MWWILFIFFYLRWVLRRMPEGSRQVLMQIFLWAPPPRPGGLLGTQMQLAHWGTGHDVDG